MRHTDFPTRHDVETLASIREPWCVSIYTPGSDLAAGANAVRIETKAQFRTAVSQLEAAGAPEEVVESLTASVERVLTDPEFWLEESQGAAVFASVSTQLSFRLPLAFKAVEEVSDRFLITPLLSTVVSPGVAFASSSFPRSAYVLAIAKDSVRLVDVSPGRSASEVSVSEMPVDFETTVALDLTNDREALAHFRTSEDPKGRIREYCRAVDKAVLPVLIGTHRPLIIAGAEPIAGIYRSVSSYELTSDTVIAGNAEHTLDDELAQKAMPILEAMRQHELTRWITRFEETSPRELAVTSLTDVAKAATFNAIETLFADAESRHFGQIDEAMGVVTESAGPGSPNYDLVNEIAGRVIAAGGTVLTVAAFEVPGGGPVAAILRFPLNAPDTGAASPKG